MTSTRVVPPFQADEIPMLLSYLEFHRSTLGMKCAGLSDEQLREQSVRPSPLSLAGLIRHMADVERSWFRRRFAGEDAPPLYFTDDEPDGAFVNIADADVKEAFSSWQRECEMSRHVAAATPTLDSLSVRERNGEKVSLRWVLMHMIEEYARHNGHADLLRERIDGAVGE